MQSAPLFFLFVGDDPGTKSLRNIQQGDFQLGRPTRAEVEVTNRNRRKLFFFENKFLFIAFV